MNTGILKLLDFSEDEYDVFLSCDDLILSAFFHLRIFTVSYMFMSSIASVRV